jgi:hypothetical protein
MIPLGTEIPSRLAQKRVSPTILEAEAKKQAERDRIGIALAVGHGVKEFEPSALSPLAPPFFFTAIPFQTGDLKAAPSG